MLKYKEKDPTIIDGREVYVIVDVTLYAGYLGCGPYGLVTMPAEPGKKQQVYSIDLETLADHFEQIPDQTVELDTIDLSSPYERTGGYPET